MILFKKLDLRELPLNYKLYFLKLFLKFEVKSFDEIKEFELIRKKNDFKILFFIVNLLNPIYKLYKRVNKLVK